MNLKEKLLQLLKSNARVSVYITGESERYLVGFMSAVEDDYIEIQMKDGMKIIPIEKIGYISLST